MHYYTLAKIRLVLILLLLVIVPSAQASNYLIGTYYFPGWTENVKGLVYPVPWKPIKPYPEREPLLGWYKDNNPDILKKQTDMMRKYGINFVVFDWYWGGTKPNFEQALVAFKKSKTPGEMKYALLWANHFDFPGGLNEYRLMIRNWITQHFSDQDYLRIDGKPVLIVFSIDEFQKTARKFAVPLSKLLEEAQSIAREAGYPGIYFVGGTPAIEHWVKRVAFDAKFSGLTAYNYHIGYSGKPDTASATSRSYPELDSAYRQNWKWILANSGFDYLIPMTSGWDKRPWGGSRDPQHDKCVSTPAQFEGHLIEAKRFMDLYPTKTHRMGIICCWNEFGEGSYIEPTKQGGFKYLEVIKKVFGGK